MSRTITEPEFATALRAKLAAAGIARGGVRAVTGPGRSGSVTAVYASHLLGAPFLPHGMPCPPELQPLLVIDTAIQSGRTLRKAVARHERAGVRVTGLAVFHEPPRVRFWYEVDGIPEQTFCCFTNIFDPMCYISFAAQHFVGDKTTRSLHMSHAIDQSSVAAGAIAFVRVNRDQLSSLNRGFHTADGTPWHKPGTEIQPGDDRATITAKAGLAYDVLLAPVQYTVPKLFSGINLGELREASARDVLFRSDTGADLGIVSRKGYKVHQPREVLDLFFEIASLGGFNIETLGALDGGKRIWALARAGEGANVIGLDEVRPYVLLATSFDGSLATVGQFTACRVVCANTISIALANHSGKRVTLPHRSAWDAAHIRNELGLVHAAFDQFMTEAKQLAQAELKLDQAQAVIAQVLAKRVKAQPGQAFDIKESKGFKQILGLFQGGAIGSDLTGGATAWQLLNAITEHVDHHRGGRALDPVKAASTRLNGAWFGDGDALKTEAKDALLELIA